MTAKSKTVTFEWMYANRTNIKFMAIARTANVPYTRIANAFRFNRTLGVEDLGKISATLQNMMATKFKIDQPDES